MSAGWALGDIGGEKALEGLIQKLRHLSPDAWLAAVEALGEIGDRRAMSAPVEIADPCGGSQDIRFAAVTLQKLDDGSLSHEADRRP